ncbi:hypothetical protein H9M94_00050 [Mycoplasma sp. Pen4]|uniref:HinT-interacting membrane complex protein P80 n=1 Tax=Mycoplasma sp. Pen4 TaxID=640330 RepID=UPI0016543FE7|nr:hypothetical protein [Mycoplasma sp. Pen4]QNM93658.1 hypothetical protein H9M94_00050 [Mycoplasma sp. Pen4]
MAKRQKSFFERLTEMNDRHDEKKKKQITNKSKRKKTLIIAFSALAVGVIAAITIPLAVTVTNKNYKQPISNETKLVTISGPKNSDLSSITVGSATKFIEDNGVKVSKEIQDAYRQSTFYFYEKEVAASVQYQKDYNESLLEGEKVNNSIALRSLDEIKKDVQNKLADLESLLKKTYGYEHWEEKYIETLKTDQYGKSTSTKEAVDYLTFKEVEAVAKRRFEITFEKTTLKNINRVANKDIYKVNVNGEVEKDTNGKPIVLFNKGDKIYPFYKENVNYFVSPTNPEEVITLTTRSFDPVAKVVETRIQDFFNENGLTIPTVYDLPGIPSNDLYSAFNVSDEAHKKVLKALLKYNIRPNSDGTSFEISSNIELLKSFKDVTQYAVKSQDETNAQYLEKLNTYRTYLNALTLSTDQKLGTTGVVTSANLFTRNLDLGLGSISKEVFESASNKLPTVSLTEMFKLPAEKQAQIDSLVTEAKAAQNISDATNKVLEIDKNIDQYIDSLTKEQYEALVKGIFNANLVKESNGRNLLSFVYSITDMPDALLITTDKGLKIVRFTNIDTIEKFNDLIKQDALNKLGNDKTYFNIIEQLNDVSSEDILGKALVNKDFKDQLEKSDAKLFTSEKVNELANSISLVTNGIADQKLITSLTNANNWINKTTSTETSYNFTIQDSKIKISYDPTAAPSENSATQIIFDAITKSFKKGAK